eukprot:38043-Amorphochlora_amoeboformis.AAC.2
MAPPASESREVRLGAVYAGILGLVILSVRNQARHHFYLRAHLSLAQREIMQFPAFVSTHKCIRRSKLISLALLRLCGGTGGQGGDDDYSDVVYGSEGGGGDGEGMGEGGDQ